MTKQSSHTCKARRAGTRSRKAIALSAVAAACLLLGATASANAAGVTIEKSWMRFIIKARPAGGYFTLHNDTAKPVELTGASSDACGMVMLHQTKEVNGVEHMMPVKSVRVPAHGTVKFQPGGYHIMCMKPKDSMVVGHKVSVTLKFKDGSTVTALFQVTGPGDK